ncbi:nucleotide sugar dehydrogenase [Methanogenium sp. MK-MG]|uniref:nucleotide sugar dehydrogenase n=1 Tax=Methanogenium sp. MK-MG TaxID=2599926 RepID=UPI0013EC8277|nr:nucleotide sugar dehydrogenase [Methanogenium sp. MK-MG]KAF1079000.1 UDP-N-acetyl-D-mannosamine dehydrogenase [Methanogenium sp. MK-MG]
MNTNTSTKLQQLFEKRGPVKTIGVIGMGYVGIPAAVLFADASEFSLVYGFQRASKSSGYKIGMLNSGVSPLKGEEPGLEDLIAKVVGKDGGENSGKPKFTCTSDLSKIAECDAVTLAIQTPFENPKDLIPNFTPLIEGIRNVGRYLTPGTLVVLESTITPGTTTGMAREILEEESWLVAGEDFGLAHAPERVMVGRLLKNIREHDRIVGGIDNVSTKRACELYGPVLTKGELIPMSATAAEVTKTAENTFRDLQIAAANQLALYCEAMGINFYEVRTGVDSLKGEGITRAILWPGAGVGGHCLTKDTYHLERGVEQLGPEALDWPDDIASLYVSSRLINDFMPSHMLHLTESALQQAALAQAGAGRTDTETMTETDTETKTQILKGAKIALLGWAFLNDSDDARNTPAEPFYQAAIAAGAEVRIHDPWVDRKTAPDVPEGADITRDLDAVLRGADAVVIFAGHKEYRTLAPAEVKELCGCSHPVLVDGRNVADPDAWIGAGYVYRGIGRGDKNQHPLVE